MNYGDHSLDVPTITGPGVSDPVTLRNDAQTALSWVKEYIGMKRLPFRSKIKWNQHDFGSYPSIEVYVSAEAREPLDHGDYCEETDCSQCEEHSRLRNLLNELDTDYCKQFEKHL